jgi:site-specific recombinase XerD
MAGGNLMKPIQFKSSLADTISNFITRKHLEEKKYFQPAKILRCFDRFLVQQNFSGPLVNQHLFDLYAKHCQNLNQSTRYNYLVLIQQFLRYLRLFQPQSYVPEFLPVKKTKNQRFFIYNHSQICALLSAAKSLQAQHSIRAQLYYFLIGILYSTGLRISEALALNLNDFHEDQKFLYVSKGKFNKDRLVPLSNSTFDALKQYLKIRQKTASISAETPIFINSKNERLSYCAVYKTFRKLLKNSDLANKGSPYPPRIHDLRHTFAVNRLLKWYHDGEDINVKLPALATYMGHANLSDTQIYLHSTADILQQRHRRFYKYFQQNIKIQGGSK